MKAGANQPVVYPLDGTRKGKDPSWLEVTLPPGPLEKKKKKTSSGQGTWTGRVTSRDYEPAGVGVPPSIPLLPCQGPWTGWPIPSPFIPAFGAFKGPKQRNTMLVLEMASTAGTCHWVTTALDGIDTTDDALSCRPRCLFGKAALCPLHRIEAAQLGFHTPCLHPSRQDVLPAGH